MEMLLQLFVTEYLGVLSAQVFAGSDEETSSAARGIADDVVRLRCGHHADLFPTTQGNLPLLNPTSFGEDAAGEPYLTDFGNGIGKVYKIVKGR